MVLLKWLVKKKKKVIPLLIWPFFGMHLETLHSETTRD